MSDEVRWLTETQQHAWRAYLCGSALLAERLDQDLRALGLSMHEYEVLVRLSEASESQVRMSELADSVHQSRSRLTHTVARMERGGLVRRWTCDSDGRGVWARLTDHGWRRLVEAAPVHVRGVRALLVDAADPADLEAVDRVFTAAAERAKPTANEAVGAGPAGATRSADEPRRSCTT